MAKKSILYNYLYFTRILGINYYQLLVIISLLLPFIPALSGSSFSSGSPCTSKTCVSVLPHKTVSKWYPFDRWGKLYWTFRHWISLERWGGFLWLQRFWLLRVVQSCFSWLDLLDLREGSFSSSFFHYLHFFYHFCS